MRSQTKESEHFTALKLGYYGSACQSSSADRCITVEPIFYHPKRDFAWVISITHLISDDCPLPSIREGNMVDTLSAGCYSGTTTAHKIKSRFLGLDGRFPLQSGDSYDSHIIPFSKLSPSIGILQEFQFG